MFQRAIRCGRGQPRLRQSPQIRPAVRRRGAPGYLYGELVIEGLRVMKCALLLDAKGLFRARWKFNVLYGAVIQARALRQPED